jgi:hypothetical protein
MGRPRKYIGRNPHPRPDVKRKSKASAARPLAKIISQDAALDILMEHRFGLRHRCRTCEKTSTFHRLKSRMAYACSCGDLVFPCAGTVFEKTHLPINVWLHAILILEDHSPAKGRAIGAVKLARRLGVSYKTACRIMSLRYSLDIPPGLRFAITKWKEMGLARRNRPVADRHRHLLG